MQAKQQLVSHFNDQANSLRQMLQLFYHQLSERCFDHFSALKNRVAELGNKLDEAFYEARSQKFTMGGLCLGAAAEGQWGV